MVVRKIKLENSRVVLQVPLHIRSAGLNNSEKFSKLSKPDIGLYLTKSNYLIIMIMKTIDGIWFYKI